MLWGGGGGGVELWTICSTHWQELMATDQQGVKEAPIIGLGQSA